MNIFSSDNISALLKLPRSAKARLVIAALAVVLVAMIAHRTLHQLFDQPSAQTLAVSAMTAKTHTVVMGTSHILYGVDPAEFPVATVNLAAGFLDYHSLNRLWNYHSGRMPNLKRVVIEIGAGSIFLDRYNIRSISPDELIDLHYFRAMPFWEQVWDFDRYFRRVLRPLILYRISPKTLSELGDVEQTRQEILRRTPGFIAIDVKTTPEQARKLAEGKVKWILEATSETVIDRNRKALIKLLNSFNRLGVEVVLLRMPLHPAARSAVPDHWLAESFRTLELAKQTLSSAPREIDLLLYSELENDDFRDGDHLNASGASKVTAEILRRLAD